MTSIERLQSARDLSLGDAVRLRELALVYSDESGDKSNPPLFHINRFLRDEPITLWVLRCGGYIFGYAITDFIRFDQKRSLFIVEAFISPMFRRTSVVADGMRLFEDHARLNKCASLSFGTRRSARAYARLFSRIGWEQADTYFTKDLGERSHG